MSIRRQNRWMLANISAPTLFWAGVLTLIAYLFQDELPIRAGQVVLFAVLAVVAGKRLQWVYFVTITVSITVFHLLVPSGRVVWEMAGFAITTGALQRGIFKALTIVGMVFLSLWAVRADLRLPGRVGALVARIFWAFEQIMERRGVVRASAPLRSADELLLSLYTDLGRLDDTDTARRKETALRTSALGWLAVAIVVLSQWVVLLFSLST